MTGVRLQKFLAECGVASRRACEELIVAGRVRVNGQPATKLGTTITPGRDRIELDGRRLAVEKKAYVLVNKPVGIICTNSDPEGRMSVLDLLRRDTTFPHRLRLFSVGRLDFDSEGLLILTNDGELANLLAHPRHFVDKVYLVWTHGALSSDNLQKLKEGVLSEGESLRVKSLCLHSRRAGMSCYEVVLAEGRNRHIRRMFAALKLDVARLRRIRVGPLDLGHLRTGAWRFLRSDEVQQLRKCASAACRRQERENARNSDEPPADCR